MNWKYTYSNVPVQIDATQIVKTPIEKGEEVRNREDVVVLLISVSQYDNL